jgi:hypothetical protein
LAIAPADPDLLRVSHPGREDVAIAQGVDLIKIFCIRHYRVEEKVYWLPPKSLIPYLEVFRLSHIPKN